MKPDCSKWKMWKGPEIEGKTDIGVMTLFVRDDDGMSFPALSEIISHYERVWFCIEYTNYERINSLFIRHPRVSFNVEVNDSVKDAMTSLNKFIVKYYKMDLKLNKGDHICIGSPYKDESFLIGDGHSVTEADYSQDRKII